MHCTQEQQGRLSRGVPVMNMSIHSPKQLHGNALQQEQQGRLSRGVPVMESGQNWLRRDPFRNCQPLSIVTWRIGSSPSIPEGSSLAFDYDRADAIEQQPAEIELLDSHYPRYTVYGIHTALH